MQDREYLHDWMFHYNPYRKTWYGIPRDSYLDYWHDSSDPKIIKSSDIKTLLEILHKVQGDVSKIKSVLK